MSIFRRRAVKKCSISLRVFDEIYRGLNELLCDEKITQRIVKSCCTSWCVPSTNINSEKWENRVKLCQNKCRSVVWCVRKQQGFLCKQRETASPQTINPCLPAACAWALRSHHPRPPPPSTSLSCPLPTCSLFIFLYTFWHSILTQHFHSYFFQSLTSSLKFILTNSARKTLFLQQKWGNSLPQNGKQNWTRGSLPP